MITLISKTLHEAFPDIAIYTEKVTKPAKTYFKIQVLSSNLMPTFNDSYTEGNLYSIQYVTEPSQNTNYQLSNMKYDLTFALRDFLYSGVDFVILDNTLHCNFTLYETICQKSSDLFVDNLSITKTIE